MSALGVSPAGAAALAALFLAAGIVRGFSGFGLSALAMAAAAPFVAPVELIPALWFVETAASLLLAQGSVRDGDLRIALPLAVGGAAGWPLGLALTVSLPVETSRIVALSVVAALAAAQLGGLRLAALRAPAALPATGLVAGIASGLANVGGMVVALWVLSTGRSAAEMRGSLLLYLLLGAATSFVILALYGLMTREAALRGFLLAIPAGLGVLIGARLFTPRLARHYRPACLTLIVGLAGFGLARAALA